MHTLAQSLTLPGSTTSITGPLGSSPVSIGSIITNAYQFILPIGGIALLVMIIIAGFSLLTSAGDAKKMEQGKQRLTYAVIGFIVVFIAYWLTQLMGVIFGIEDIGRIFR